MKKIQLQDKIRIINATVDGYGDPVILDQKVVRGAFFPGTSTQRSNDTDMIMAYDAHCYVDETDTFVVENDARLEGMYLVYTLFGHNAADSWYKIADVKPGITKIRDNTVNNVHCFLTKCEPIELVESL